MELLFLALAASISLASAMMWSRARSARAEPPRLPAGDRTPLTLQLGDVVEQLDRDWLVDGAVALSESPRAARLCRLMDGAEERFLYAGTQADDMAWLLVPIAAPPDTRATELTHDGERLHLERRWRASVLAAGKLGKRAFDSEVAVYEYAGAGGRLLLLLEGATKTSGFFGERLLPHAFSILPSK